MCTLAPAAPKAKTQRTFFQHARWLSLSQRTFVIQMVTEKGKVKETAYRLEPMSLPGQERGWKVSRLDGTETYWIGVDRGFVSCDCGAASFDCFRDNRPCKHMASVALLTAGDGFPSYVIDYLDKLPSPTQGA